ncbi:MAG: sugar phosphate isomerase/epimerase [Nitrosopumilus sp.]|nr:sugar phosphate isomerase/epimerase [Nitrosopumilus sp.]
MAFSYSITLSSFLNIEEICNTLEKLSAIGFNQLEMYGEPDEANLKFIHDILLSFNFKIIGVTGMWGKISSSGWKRRLLSNDVAFKKYSEDYVIKCIEMCSYFGGNKINICLFSDPINSFDVTHRFISQDDKRKILSKNFSVLNNLANRSKEFKIDLLLEPLNRYSTPYCSNLEDVLFVITNCDNLGVLLDTYHMNIEEDSFKNTILKSKDFLCHLHFADNNRKMPGFGHIDFEQIVSSLKDISYSGTKSFEPNISSIDYQKDLLFGIKYMENIELKYQ